MAEGTEEAHPTPDSTQESGAVVIPRAKGERRDRLSLLIPALLAAIGLAAALVAWRASGAAGAADAATQAGLDAARQRAASVVVGEGLTARSTEAYVDFERASRRANLLAEDGRTGEALLARMEAVSHWFLVRPEYLAPDGSYQPDRQRAALLAADEATRDIQPEPHFAAADLEYARIRSLLMAGVLIGLALPLPHGGRGDAGPIARSRGRGRQRRVRLGRARRGDGLAVRAGRLDRMRAHLAPDADPGKAGRALALALLTLLAATVAGLQGNASLESQRSARIAEGIALEATGASTSRVIQVGVAYGIYRRWFEELERSAWASSEAVKAAAEGDKTRLEALQRIGDDVAAWIRQQSPLLQPPLYDPELGSSDFAAFEAETLVGPNVTVTDRRSAELAVANEWGARASSFVTALTVIAVGLFFVGLASTVAVGRRFLAALGVIFGVGAAAWAIAVSLPPVHRIPESAIEHLAASQVALARAPLLSGFAAARCGRARLVSDRDRRSDGCRSRRIRSTTAPTGPVARSRCSTRTGW